jgi:hypothetical protein
MEDDWIQQAIRDFQDKITRGTYDGIYALPDDARDRVMEAQARSCVHACIELFAIPADLDLEGFLEHMKLGGSGKVDIQRDGDVIVFDEHRGGECMCPLVKRAVIRLEPALCGCGVHWIRMLFERHTDRPVSVELIDSVAQGSRNCRYRITLGRGTDA